MVYEARRAGIDILPPDVNASDTEFTIDASGKAIRFALNAIKNVGSGAAQTLVAARRAGGEFRSLDDFCHRVDARQVNKRALESLIKAGAMDRFGRRSQLLSVMDRMLNISQATHQASDRGQPSLFGTDFIVAEPKASIFGALPDEPEIPNRDRLQNEQDLTGAFFSDNPLMRLARSSRQGATHWLNQLDESLAGQKVNLIGVVTPRLQ